MKKQTKALLTLLCAVLLVVGSVMGTLAYLTSQDSVTNTFTVGDVKIFLDEAKVNVDGEPVDANGNPVDDVANAPRVDKNEYHLLPGHTYTKDPMVTVEADSEESYVRMLVTFNFSKELDEIFAANGANMTDIFVGYSAENWPLFDITEDEATNTRTYEFRYKDTVLKSAADQPLDPLFDAIAIPGFINNDQLATLMKYDAEGKLVDQFKINVVAHAIQADGLDTDDEAWAAFDIQNAPVVEETPDP